VRVVRVTASAISSSRAIASRKRSERSSFTGAPSQRATEYVSTLDAAACLPDDSEVAGLLALVPLTDARRRGTPIPDGPKCSRIDSDHALGTQLLQL
jgi:predicted RNA polymerase sigma factor